MAESILVTLPDRQSAIFLPDGRKLAWAEWGAVDGLPILFCTGAGMTRWLGFGMGDLTDLGLRLIAIDRPGLGGSDPHPTKTFASWVADIRYLIQQQNLQNVMAVGFSQGAPFALALAEQQLVQAIALVAGQDDLAHPTFQSQLEPGVAQMIATIEQNPTSFVTEITQMATADWLWKMIIAMSAECDQQVYSEYTFQWLYRQSLQDGFIQGAMGYAGDLVNTLSRWPMQLGAISVPVDLWYGSLDISPVHSPDFGITLAQRLPNANRIIDQQSGSAILWTRSAAILARLKSYIRL